MELTIANGYRRRPYVRGMPLRDNFRLADNPGVGPSTARSAFPRTYPGTLSGLPVIWEQFGTIVSAVWVVPLFQLTGTNLTGLISCLR